MKIKKILVAGVVCLSMIGGIECYAAEGQSLRWEGSGEVWRVKTADGNGYLVNSWFQDDVSGYWYMLGADGGMFSGLITDNSTGKTYLMNINHDGSFGRMVTENGVYNGVQLEFNQAHDGSFGAIISGLDGLRNTGVNETKLDSIPADNGGQEQVETQTNEAKYQVKITDPSDTSGIIFYDENSGVNGGYEPVDESGIVWM